jgi:hypothetical protein
MYRCDGERTFVILKEEVKKKTENHAVRYKKEKYNF